MIGVAGDSLVRLTKDFGSNEDPTFSPDNEFIAFSSQRIIGANKEKKHIHIMTTEGEIIKKITSGSSIYQSPTWSK